MLEIPESFTIARQLNETVNGKIISFVQANHSPHSFAWYSGDPVGYDELLAGKRAGSSYARGGMVEMRVEDCTIVIGDGVSLRYYEDLKKVPKKHQLYMEFDDNTALAATIQMYGGIWAYKEGTNDSSYYHIALEKPSPLTQAFDLPYFLSLRDSDSGKLSAKAFLATKQRIPGLGNGVLQDILYLAGIHPKRKMTDVTEKEYEGLFRVIKDTLAEMAEKGGRDTEKDIYGNPGGYMTWLSKKTHLTPCPKCGTEIRKASYLGGTIYFCEKCQR